MKRVPPACRRHFRLLLLPLLLQGLLCTCCLGAERAGALPAGDFITSRWGDAPRQVERRESGASLVKKTPNSLVYAHTVSRYQCLVLYEFEAGGLAAGSVYFSDPVLLRDGAQRRQLFAALKTRLAKTYRRAANSFCAKAEKNKAEKHDAEKNDFDAFMCANSANFLSTTSRIQLLNYTTVVVKFSKQ